jgi:hypothetical protein
MASNWPLLTGGRYSEVVFTTGLTGLEQVRTGKNRLEQVRTGKNKLEKVRTG